MAARSAPGHRVACFAAGAEPADGRAAAGGRRRFADLSRRRPVRPAPGRARSITSASPSTADKARDLHHHRRIGQRQDDAGADDPGHRAAEFSGTIRFRGRDLATIRHRADRLAFMRLVQPIFQNPFEAFNPLKRVDRYLFMTARRFAGATTRPPPSGWRTRRCSRSACRWRSSAAAIRTNCPAGSCSGSPSPAP